MQKLQYFMEELTHWKRPWCWARLKAGGEGDDSRRDGWMASPTQWTWVWASPGIWWRTRKTGCREALQSMRSQSRTWLSDWTELRLIVIISQYTHISNHYVVYQKLICYILIISQLKNTMRIGGGQCSRIENYSKVCIKHK